MSPWIGKPVKALDTLLFRRPAWWPVSTIGEILLGGTAVQAIVEQKWSALPLLGAILGLLFAARKCEENMYKRPDLPP